MNKAVVKTFGCDTLIMHYVTDKSFFPALKELGFKRGLINGQKMMAATVMSMIPYRALNAGIYDWPSTGPDGAA